MGPACALHDGRLAFTVTVTAATVDEALRHAFTAAQSALTVAGVPDDEEVSVTRVNMESAQPRELVTV